MSSIATAIMRTLGLASVFVALGMALGPPAHAQLDADAIRENRLGVNLFWEGRYVEAIVHFERGLAMTGVETGTLAYLLPNVTLSFELVGRRDDALSSAMRDAKIERHSRLHFYTGHPTLEELCADPRFQPIRLQLERARDVDLERTFAEVMERRRQLDEVRRQQGDSIILWQDGHSERLRDLAFSPGGDRLVSAGYDRTVRLWSTRFEEPPRTLDVCSQQGVTVQYSAGGDLILVHDSETLTASLYDGRNGDLRLNVHDASGGVRSVAFAGDGWLWAVTHDGRLQRWNTDRGGVEREVVPDVPVGAVTASSDGSLLITRGEDDRARLCDGKTGAVLRSFGPRLPGVVSAEFLPDERLRLACHGGRDYLYAPDGTGPAVVLKGWRRLENNTPSRDGSRVLTMAADDTLHLCDTSTGETVTTVVRSGDSDPAGAAAADDLVAVRFGQLMHVWNARSGAFLGKVQAVLLPEALQRSSDGRFALGLKDGIFLCDASGDGRELVSHAGRIQSISLGADQRIAVGLGGYRMVETPPGPWSPEFPPHFPSSTRVWDLSTGARIDIIERTLSSYVRYGPDGATLGVGSPYGNALILPDGSRRSIAGKSRSAIRFSPDGERALATVPYPPKPAILTTLDGKVLGSISGLGQVGEQSDQCPARFSPDGVLIVTAQDGGEIRVSDGHDSTEIVRLEGHTKSVTEFAFDLTGTRLASTSDDGTARVWDFETMEPIAELTGHDGRVWSCAFNADGTLVATAGVDATVRLWDPETGAQRALLAGHTDVVRWVGFHPVTGQVLSTSFDGTARLWNTETGTEVRRLIGHTGGVKGAEFAEDGRIVTWASDASVRVWSAGGDLLATHVEYDEGGWLTFEPGGRYIAGGRAEEWAQVQVRGKTYPLSSYASLLRDPKAVQDSLAGRTPSALPRLAEAPRVRTLASINGEVAVPEVQLSFLLEDAVGLDDITIERDGAPWASGLAYGGLRRDQEGRIYGLELALPFDDGADEIIVRVRVTNRTGVKSVPVTIRRTYVPPAGDLYVVALAVSDYDDDRLDLASPVKDAADIVARFEAEAGGLYREVHTRLLDGTPGHSVTRSALEDLLEEFLGEAGPLDTILVFVAGHGARTAGGRYFFLTPGATPESPTRGIPRRLLEELVTWEGLQARRRVLLIDTCRAGDEFVPGAPAVRGLDSRDAFAQDEVDASLGSGIYIVSGSTEFGAARETESNGVFTRALLDGLDGAADDLGNRDGMVDIAELIAFATNVVRKAEGSQRVTTPDMRVIGGNPFPLARSRR